MRIALNIEAVGSKRGGAEKYAGMLAEWLVRAGHEVHVFARIVDEEELPSQTRIHRIESPAPPGLGWRRAQRFAANSARELARHDFDLVVGFVKVWRQDACIAVAGTHPASLVHNSRRFRQPYRTVWWLGKLLSPKQWSFRSLERRQFHSGQVPLIIAPSRMVAEQFHQYHAVPYSRIVVVPNGIKEVPDLVELNRRRAGFRKRHKLGEDEVAVLFAAHNYPLKGLEPLLLAFAPVARQRPEAVLFVCGSPRDDAYRRLARRLGIAEQVRFEGFVDDIRAAFAGSDLFAFPTFYDPGSLVVPEAMASGLPVITTKQNGAADLVTEGVHGFVIDDPWSTDALAAGLDRLIADRRLRLRMGENGRRRAAEVTLDVVMPKLLDCLTRTARMQAGAKQAA